MGLFSRSQEEKLIRRAAGGDRPSAERLVKAHQDSVYAYLLRLSGRPEVAEDVVQEAFIRVLTNLDRFDSRYRFSTWLFTIARRIYINATMKKRPSLDSGGMLELRADPSPRSDQTEQSELDAAARMSLDAALARLPEEQREVVVLFHQFDWPLWLIAEQLGMPVGTVKSHLHRARTRLRELMRAVEPTPEPRTATLVSGLRLVRSIVTRRHEGPASAEPAASPAKPGATGRSGGRDAHRGGGGGTSA